MFQSLLYSFFYLFKHNKKQIGGTNWFKKYVVVLENSWNILINISMDICGGFNFYVFHLFELSKK